MQVFGFSLDEDEIMLGLTIFYWSLQFIMWVHCLMELNLIQVAIVAPHSSLSLAKVISFLLENYYFGIVWFMNVLVSFIGVRWSIVLP